MKEMRDNAYSQLISDINSILYCGLYDFLDANRDNGQCLYQIKEYVEEAKHKYRWDEQKAKIIFSVLQLKDSGNIQEIISYLEQSDFGWQGNEYKSYNRCLHFGERCRRNRGIDNNSAMTAQAFADMDSIFLHKEYGAITTYLFGYCLTSLFSSRLRNQNSGIPYFLQIACNSNSNTYRLVHEIAQICDVNAGLVEKCDNLYYKECDHDHMIIVPSTSAEKQLETLIYYRDIPVVVDGYGDEKYYVALLRETANLFGRTRRLDLKAKFNVLPIFLCPRIQSRYQNVFSMDLTNLDIADEYIELILENKQRLGSWVYELVRDAKKTYFDIGNSSSYSSRPELSRIIQSRASNDGDPLFYDLHEYLIHARSKNSPKVTLTSKDLTNVGYLTYFFSHFMKVFQSSIRLSEGTPFLYRGVERNHNPSKLIANLNDEAMELLIQLHSTFAPMQHKKTNISVECSDSTEVKRIKKDGALYADNIVKYYKSYKVSIELLHEAEYKDNRYIFCMKLLPGTDKKMIARYKDEVRTLLGVKVFEPDINSDPMKLVVSQEALKESNLFSILKNPQFINSDMEIPYAVGYDITGKAIIADVAKFPHLLVGGTSGFGKSSALHSLLMSIVYKQPADKVKLLLIDFGASALNSFDKAPHMLCPTIGASEIEKGRKCILWLQREMENRIKKKESQKAKVFAQESRKWPSIVCVIDEFPTFIQSLTDGKENKKSGIIIEDLLARARKVKIHFVLAAQDTTHGGLGIKNTNLAAGIAFQCEDWHTSKAIIGEPDAVNLQEPGDMYFRHSGLKRLKGSYLDDDEIEEEVDKIKFFYSKKYDEVEFDIPAAPDDISTEIAENSPPVEDGDEKLVREIAQYILDNRLLEFSNNLVKNEFRKGYKVADRIMQRLEDLGIVTKLEAKKRRVIDLVKAQEFLQRNEHDNGMGEQSVASGSVSSDTDTNTDTKQTQKQIRRQMQNKCKVWQPPLK